MRKYLYFPLLVLVVLVGLSGAVIAQDDGELPVFDDLVAGEWNSISPGEDTVCLYDTDYQFFVRPAEEPTEDLMIYFEGGGACWNDGTCSAVGQFASRYDVPDTLMDNYNDGFFEFDNPANPVADYNVVFVPYCSGDVHSGSSDFVDYENIDVNYNGVDNAQAVLDWTYENFTAPDDVFVTGCSAGGYGATYHAPFVMENYPDNRVVHLADAATGVTPMGWDGYNQWDIFSGLPEFVEDLDEATIDTYSNNLSTIASANAFPNNVFAQYNTFIDEVQVAFYGIIIGEPALDEASFVALAQEWSPALIDNLTEISTSTDNFFSYTAGGTLHCITGLPELYTYAYDGLTVADWVDSLLTGDAMSDVSCDVVTGECLTAPSDDMDMDEDAEEADDEG